MSSTSDVSDRWRLDRVLRFLHAWLGAAVAMIVLIVSITGIVIAFSSQLLHVETGAFPAVESRLPGQPADVSQLVNAARQKAGPDFLPLGYLGPNAEIATSVEMVYGLSAPPDSGGEVQIVTFDPSTNESLGVFLLDRTITHRLIDMHYSLLSGRVGEIVVAIVGLMIVALAIVGGYLWFPRRGSLKNKLGRRPPLRNWYRNSFRSHSVVGFWFALPVLIWSVTGIVWSQPQWIPNFIMPDTVTLESTKLEALTGTTCNEDVSVAEAVNVAMSDHSDYVLLEATFAAPWQPYHVIHLSNDADTDKKDGDLRVWVSSTCKDRYEFASVAGLGAIGGISPSLHSAESFGMLRVPVILLVGLGFVFLSMFGLMAWWRQYVSRTSC